VRFPHHRYPEEIAAVEHFFVPHGLVPFANEDAFSQMSRQVDAFLSSK
jgi:hypothetical protein